MPESVTDRPTRSHEYIFLLTKSERYFWDQEAVREENAPATVERAKYHWCKDGNKASNYQDLNGLNRDEDYPINPSGRNIRSVWTIATQPYPDAHYATFPEALVERCVKAGSKIGDIVLDPFCGSGTVVRVSERLQRIGMGLDMGYQELSIKRRTNNQVELFA